MSLSSVKSLIPTAKFGAVLSVALSIILTTIVPQYSIRHSVWRTAILLFFLHLLVFKTYTVIIYPKFLSPLRHLPTVTKGQNFILGQWLTITGEPSGVPMRRWQNETPNQGIVRYLGLFNSERLLLTSPKAIAEVLQTKSYEFQRPGFLLAGLTKILGVGLLVAEGDDHKFQRKGLMPAFNFRHIKDLYPIFWSKSRLMVRQMEEEELVRNAPNVMVDIGEWSSRAALDIIGLGGMGQDFHSLTDPNTELNTTYRKIFAPSRTAQILGLMSFFLPLWFVQNLPVDRTNDINAASKLIRNVARQLVKQKKQMLANKEKLSPDIISTALESGYFTDEKLVDNIMTFLAAGHETTASSMTWAAYLLARHPEVQTKLREEIRKHIGSLDDEVDDNIIDNIPYLHAVVQEVLRVYSPVPITIRTAVKDTSILDQPVPKGTFVLLAPWATNLNKDLWGPDADDFNPERWMKPGQANSGGATSNYAFLTFLHGSRSCIGQKFATAEMACLLAAFVGRFEFVQSYPDEEIIVKGGITARPRNGMRLNLKVVEGW